MPTTRTHSSTNFYPRPPRGGRRSPPTAPPVPTSFLSTPSARRATILVPFLLSYTVISIHALREEGDAQLLEHLHRQHYFYPRPPRGGRRWLHRAGNRLMKFLSTPSARRATGRRGQPDRQRQISIHALREEGDGYALRDDLTGDKISIHALREEGDAAATGTTILKKIFLSTPSARRATRWALLRPKASKISIHALREEGDHPRSFPALVYGDFYPRPPRGGRRAIYLWYTLPQYFYPRPPRGGRHGKVIFHIHTTGKFLSTPSARRATFSKNQAVRPKKISIHALREEGDRLIVFYNFTEEMISIHALREEGDPRSPFGITLNIIFLSTPSARRATSDPWHRPSHRHYFYPRPPRGGRPGRRGWRCTSCYFYPRPPRGGRPPQITLILWT